MAHEVETMAWTNQVPWHGLGVKVADNLTPSQMLKAAKLDWSVSKRPLLIGDWTESSESDKSSPIPTFDLKKNTVAKDCFALVRDSDGKALDFVGPSYQPVQNEKAFEFFTEFVHAGQAKMETAGSLKGGRIVWGLANLQKSFKLHGKDEVKGYLLLCSPHMQGKAALAMCTTVRVVCNNTMRAAVGYRANEKQPTDTSDRFVFRHVREWDDSVIEEAKKTIGIAREQFDMFADAAVVLSKRKVKQDDAFRVLGQVFQPDLPQEAEIDEEWATIKVVDIEKHAKKPLKQAMAALTHAPGHDLISAAGTAWGVLNAVTYTADHLLRKNVDNRLYNAWLGKSASQKQKAFELLIG